MSTPGAEAGNPDGSEVQGESPYRLFVALATAEAAKEHIHQVQRDVGRLLGNHLVVWEPWENFHISLFLAMQDALESSVRGLGFWPPADFPFTPHVTIGRVRRDLEPAARSEVEHSLATLAVDARMGRSWTVTRVGLYVSEFVNERPAYRRLGEAALEANHEE